MYGLIEMQKSGNAGIANGNGRLSPYLIVRVSLDIHGIAIQKPCRLKPSGASGRKLSQDAKPVGCIQRFGNDYQYFYDITDTEPIQRRKVVAPEGK